MNSYPPLLFLITMKDGEEVSEECKDQNEADLILADIIADKNVSTWVLYKQVKSSYPEQS